MPHFTDELGIVVSYSTWTIERPRAVVQIAHGLGEPVSHYRDLAGALNSAGYSVYADDRRGHGQTGLHQWKNDYARSGHLGGGGLHTAIRDLSRLTQIIREENQDVPIVLLGHRWGSLMAQIVINERLSDYAAVVLTGSAFHVPADTAADDGHENRGHGITGFEWLSRDPNVAQEVVADPLAFDAAVLKFVGRDGGPRLSGRPARGLPDVPLLIQIGSADPLGGQKRVRKLASVYRTRSGLTDVEVIVYPEERDNLLSDENKDQVREDLIAWLETRITALPVSSQR